jgi:hypothetical protein
MAGRMCLGVGRGVANEVILGELGWWSVQGRREFLRLVYWGKIVRESKEGDSLVSEVYKDGRRRVEQGELGGWCLETKLILKKIGLGYKWISEEVGEDREWRRLVKGMIHAEEERKWKRGMLEKPKLRRYLRIKGFLRKEWFLTENRWWVQRWVRLRAGVARLQVETGRYTGAMRCDRICTMCNSGVVEDEEHCLDECVAWKEHRRLLWEKMAGVDPMRVRTVGGWGVQERVDWMMKGGQGRMRIGMMKGVSRLLCVRERTGEEWRVSKKIS